MSTERNITSGNDVHGVVIVNPGTNNNVVSGNYIGTDVSGTANLGNSACGVWIHEGPQSNTIGAPGNTIAFNSHEGVEVSGTNTLYNKISENSIHNNGGMGINLADGGNDEIPPPTITSNNLDGNTLTVTGNGAGANATVEIFEADSFDSGEGITYLGSLVADGSGNFSGDYDVTDKGLSVGDPLTATTTYTDNNTSEFSTSEITLPVELSVFTAKFEAGTVRLRWRTESETGNLGFNIYRSDTKDGKYVKVNAVLIKGAGTDATPHNYSFTDEDVVKGFTYYYYIEDADFSGKTNKSHIIEVTVGKQGIKVIVIPRQFALLQNYPNPFNPDTWLPYQLSDDSPVIIRIYDVKGQPIRTLDLGHFEAGYYLSKSQALFWQLM